MAHHFENLDRGAFGSNLAPWHFATTGPDGRSIIVPDSMTAEEILTLTSAGDYQVDQAPGWLPYDPTTGAAWAPAHKGQRPPASVDWIQTEAYFNLRNDVKLPNRDAILSPTGVGEGYEVVQNDEIAQIANAACGEAGAKFETGGTLKNGKLVWFLARCPETTVIGTSDVCNRYILIYSSHDGSKSIVVAATTTRVVCYNTLSWALEGTDNKVTLKHTANVGQRIVEAIEAVQQSHETFERDAATFRGMSRVALTDRFVNAYIKALTPDPETGQAKRKINRITELAYGDQYGANLDSMHVNGQPTAWGLYNAVGQYVQHDSISRAKSGEVADENRFRQNMLGGTQERTRSQAMHLLLHADENMATANSKVTERIMDSIDTSDSAGSSAVDAIMASIA